MEAGKAKQIDRYEGLRQEAIVNSVLACLQSPVLREDIHAQVEQNYLAAVKLLKKLDSQSKKLDTDCSLINAVDWFMF